MKKNKVDVIWGRPRISKVGEASGFGQKKPVAAAEPERACSARERSGEAHHRRDRRAARACCRGIEPDGKLIWTYFEAMKPKRMPKSLLVVGSAPSASNSHPSIARWART